MNLLRKLRTEQVTGQDEAVQRDPHLSGPLYSPSHAAFFHLCSFLVPQGSSGCRKGLPPMVTHPRMPKPLLLVCLSYVVITFFSSLPGPQTQTPRDFHLQPTPLAAFLAHRGKHPWEKKENTNTGLVKKPVTFHFENLTRLINIILAQGRQKKKKKQQRFLYKLIATRLEACECICSVACFVEENSPNSAKYYYYEADART